MVLVFALLGVLDHRITFMAWLSCLQAATVCVLYKHFFPVPLFISPDFMLVSLLNYNFDTILAVSNLNVIIVFFRAAHQVSSAGSHGKSRLAGQTDV